MKRIIFAALVGVLVSGPAFADHRVMTADEAKERLESGQMMLIDVRSPQEWRQTGIAKGARTVTIHNPGGLPGFVEAVKAEVGGDFDKGIAVICARGNRSTIAHQAAVGRRLRHERTPVKRGWRIG